MPVDGYITIWCIDKQGNKSKGIRYIVPFDPDKDPFY